MSMNDLQVPVANSATNKSYTIGDGSSLRHYRTELPNIIDDMGLSPYAFRLYCHLKRVAGDNGRCWQNTRTLAEICNMSAAGVCNAKKELVARQLITITNRDDHAESHVITIADLWPQNFEYFGKKLREEVIVKDAIPDCSLPERNVQEDAPQCSPYEQNVHHSAPKKEPIKKEPIKQEKTTTNDPTRARAAGQKQPSSSLSPLPSWWLEMELDEGLNQRALEAMRHRGWQENHLSALYRASRDKANPDGFLYSMLGKSPKAFKEPSQPGEQRRIYSVASSSLIMDDDVDFRSLPVLDDSDGDDGGDEGSNVADLKHLNDDPPAVEGHSDLSGVVDERWTIVLDDLRLMMSESNFDQFMGHAAIDHCQLHDQPSDLDHCDHVVVRLANPSARDWVQNRLSNAIRRSLSVLLHKPITVSFIWAQELTS